MKSIFQNQQERFLKNLLTNKNNHNIKSGKIKKCQVCGNAKLIKIIDLGNQPPCDSILDKKNQREFKYPLNFLFCKNCFLGQIDFVVPPKKLFFKKYPYRSGITKTLVEKLYSTSEMAKKKLNIPSNSLCIDIGSNDGTLLKGFKRFNLKVLGIEPTNIAKIANEDGIKTIQAFFDVLIAKKIRSSHGPARIVTATNVFAHVPNLSSLVEGIKIIIDQKGVFISESHYLIDLIKTVQYDSIYHEHLKYYSLHSLIRLFKYYNLEIFDVEFIKNYGGSIRVYTGNKGEYRVKKSVTDCLNKEKKFFDKSNQKLNNFKKNIIENRKEIVKIINKYKKEGKKVVGIGCPGRCSTFLNYCKIDSKKMDYIAEQKTSLKLNKFLPGMKIPIIDEKVMLDEQPELTIILSWHYHKEIIKILRKKGLKSKILIPLPKIKIV